MPVDYARLILGLGFAVSMMITAIAWGTKAPRRVWGKLLLATLVWGVTYGWIFHSARLIYGIPAMSGKPKALYRLGASYMHSRRGAPYDPPKGRKLLRRAAEQGYVPAQMALASYYLSGVSTPPDTTEALKWFRRAAAQGCAEAAVVIRDVQQNGYDVHHPSGRAAHIVARWTGR